MRKYIKIAIVTVMTGLLTGCNKNLDFVPEDYFADGNYWQNETQVNNFMVGIHNDLRNKQFMLFRLGEMRGGGLSNTARMDVSLNELSIINHGMTEVSPGIGAWAGFMNSILQINLFISKMETISFVPSDKKAQLLGQAYGLRAYYYFHLLRTYGGVPLRLTPDVLLDKPDAVNLRMARSSEAEVLAAIKGDIAASVQNFGTIQGTNKAYWSLNATRMLKGEVFLWSAKVYNNTADLVEAKNALNAVAGYSLLTNFGDVFKQKRNSEIIFTLPFAFNEAEASSVSLFLYPVANFNGIYYKDTVNVNAPKLVDPLNIAQASAGGIQRYAYTYELFQSYGINDQRRNSTFYDFYGIDRTVTPNKVTIRNTVLTKFMGTVNNNIRNWTDDWPIYREADRLLMLAEIANAEGTDPKNYLQPIRDRAFNGIDPLPFVNGSKDANELAIFAERAKEFVWEGKRWYDLRRMKLGGDPLAFKGTGNPYGVLNKSTDAYKLLWPVGRDVWTNDPLVEQTPGYTTTKP
ncbi:Starch-binding associating with outer membrane [Sphingobacterium nematocida]|uniref:Starch-binding associating with outer membrane n=1 Tax=Sphingobacterium nematocida TaxID=1513896 RepID=A0A1T5EZA2_9SPHI|nr:RagB/SusD family nutrient uptake outer membrane protein [Sphingobacterium nematocida]SKB89273.1 Starch-binding associating with outer membrane [Sphingobacterium nematocida]